jgi:hypothetical protein
LVQQPPHMPRVHLSARVAWAQRLHAVAPPLSRDDGEATLGLVLLLLVLLLLLLGAVVVVVLVLVLVLLLLLLLVGLDGPALALGDLPVAKGAWLGDEKAPPTGEAARGAELLAEAAEAAEAAAVVVEAAMA